MRVMPGPDCTEKEKEWGKTAKKIFMFHKPLLTLANRTLPEYFQKSLQLNPSVREHGWFETAARSLTPHTNIVQTRGPSHRAEVQSIVFAHIRVVVAWYGRLVRILVCHGWPLRFWEDGRRGGSVVGCFGAGASGIARVSGWYEFAVRA